MQEEHLLNLRDLINWDHDVAKDQRWRKQKVAALKYAENYGKCACLGFGRKLFEAWANSLGRPLPGDVLINLAYYRRRTGDVRAALQVTECLAGTDFRRDLSNEERGVLATERAAALMDFYKRGSKIALSEAEKFLKYSFRANAGTNSEHNRTTWQKYDRLRDKYCKGSASR